MAPPGGTSGGYNKNNHFEETSMFSIMNKMSA